MPRSLPPVTITDPLDQKLSEFRQLSGYAVIGLIFGLLSPIALIDVFLIIVPVIGICFNFVALRQIKKNAKSMTGRKMAILGLMLSLIFCAGGPINEFVRQQSLYSHAQQVADAWWKCILEGQPRGARDMMDVNLAQEDDRLPPLTPEQDLQRFVAVPDIKLLLAIGPRAQVRLYDAYEITSYGGKTVIPLMYAVTYENSTGPGNPSERTSFFVIIQIGYDVHPFIPKPWVVLGALAGVRPRDWPSP